MLYWLWRWSRGCVWLLWLGNALILAVGVVLSGLPFPLLSTAYNITCLFLHVFGACERRLVPMVGLSLGLNSCYVVSGVVLLFSAPHVEGPLLFMAGELLRWGGVLSLGKSLNIMDVEIGPCPRGPLYRWVSHPIWLGRMLTLMACTWSVSVVVAFACALVGLLLECVVWGSFGEIKFADRFRIAVVPGELSRV